MPQIDIIANDERLDLFQGSENDLSLTLQINDLTNLNTRNASFTSQIRLPNTPKNIEILANQGFGFGFTPVFTGSRAAPTTIKTTILINGITVLTNGRLVITKRSDTEFSGQVFFDNYEFFNLIKGTIDQLQWAEFDLTWNAAGVDAIKATSTGIVFALATWFENKGILEIPASEVWSTKHDINFSGFHAYCRTIVTKIVTEVGFTLDDSAVTAALWDEIALACPIGNLTTLPAFDNPITGRWKSTADQVEFPDFGDPTDKTNFRMEFDTLVLDPDTLFDNANDKWDIDRTANVSFGISSLNGTYTNNSEDEFLLIKMMKNGVNIGQFSVDTPGSFNLAMGGVTPVENGDDLYIEIEVFNWNRFTIDSGVETYIQDTKKVIAPASEPILVHEHIPKIEKTDFLRWIFSMFNIFISTDTLAQKVTLKPFDDITTSAEQNLSKNMDVSRKIDDGLTMPYFRINKFSYAGNKDLRRTDTTGFYNIINDTLPKEGDLIKIGFGASDAAQRKGIYIRGTAVAEYPVTEMESTAHLGLNATAGTNTFAINTEGVEFKPGDYIDMGYYVGTEIRQITERISPISGKVGVNWSSSHADVTFTLRKFNFKELSIPRVARIIASQGNYDILQGTEDVVTSIVAGKEAVFHDDMLFSNIITDNYQNLMDALAKPFILKAWFRFETPELVALDFLRPVYLEKYATLFYINKINQYKSNGLCQVELIRIF